MLGTDSSSAKSMMERRGAGRIRHLHCPTLWLQERVDSCEIRMEKGKSEHKTADTGTKAVSAEVLQRHLWMLENGMARGTTSVSVVHRYTPHTSFSPAQCACIMMCITPHWLKTVFVRITPYSWSSMMSG